MMKNEKGIALTMPQLTIKNEQTNKSISMDNNTPTRNKIQLDLFVTEKTKKSLEEIHCCDCHHTRPLDGFRFKLMPVCSDCRTNRSLEILSNQIERRAKR